MLILRSTLTWTMRPLLLAAALVVSVAPLAAQDSSAKVIHQVGQVSLANGGYFKALSLGDIVKTRQLIVTGPDGYAKFQVLSDGGSIFEVFPNSKVVFRETPGDWQHLLNVFIGRIKVFIQHAPGVQNPNNVTSPTAVISVRGTVFDVQVQSDDSTFVAVDEGIVDVRNLTAAGKSATLQAGESIWVYPGVPLFAAQRDKGGILLRALYAARDAILSHPPVGNGGPGAPIPGGAGGAQGDKKGGTTTGPSAPPAGPSAPPAGPSAPPAGPGGGD